MKLAFCLFNYFPYGGLQRDFLRIAQLCAAHGHEIHVHTMQWEGERPPQFIIHEHKPDATTLQNHSRAYQFATNLQTQLRGQYDVIIGFNKMPGLDIYYAADGCFAEKLEAKPYAWLQRLLPRNRTYLALEQNVFNPHSHTQVVFIAKKNQLDYQKHYAYDNMKQSLLPPGIDPYFKTLPRKKSICALLRRQLNLDEHGIHLLMVASSFNTKGLDRAITAIASLPTALQIKIHFHVIGNDNPSDFIQLAKQLRMTATIHYHGAKDNIADWMQASDLLLHPAYYESAGLSLLEAIASGLPIITTAACGYADYIINANAGKVTAEPFKQADLNQSLLTLLSSPRDLSQYSDNAYQFAKTADFYSLPHAALQLIEKSGEKHARTHA